MSLAPPFRKPLVDTPFRPRADELNQIDSYIPWAGYSTVDVFSNVEHEYFAIRNAATLFDLTPMVKYRIAGADAERYLNRLVTRDIRKLKVNRVAYSVWCNDSGHLVGDGTIFRLGADEFRLCIGERHLDWLMDSAISFNVEIAEITEEIAALSLQGPTSYSVLRNFGVVGIEKLKVFEIGRYTVDGLDLTISRTGFTGDLGYELWMRPEQAVAIWDRLMAAGKTRGIRPIGSQALDMARIEAGFIMPHIDFISAEHTIRVGRDRSPLEMGLDWLVDFDCGHFTGRRALLAEKKRGPARRLVGLDVDGNKPAHHALIYADRAGNREVGSVTSAMWSPTCKRNIALAMIEAPFFTMGNELYADIYLNRELVWERRMCAATVVEKPFFVHERRRLTPPAEK
ncbi:MAG TPA: aminomethyltransferase family protein [Stellaceae bacterium]|nr:aminomethyltransferase family protein [Stellaceae bacterium]